MCRRTLPLRQIERGMMAMPTPVYNRANPVGLLASCGIGILSTLLLNGLIFSTGLRDGEPASDIFCFAPPGWVIGAIWVFLYALYGVAHWRASITGTDDGRRAARLVFLLGVWGLLYPFLTLGFQHGIGAILNVVSLAFTVLAICAIRRCETRSVHAAALWLIPSMLWECYAVFLGFGLLLDRAP
jgi:tryptophan-rich sensory protein